MNLKTSPCRPGFLSLAIVCCLVFMNPVLAQQTSRGSGSDGKHCPGYLIPPPFTPENDLQFIDALMPHHLAAIEMAEEVLERGVRDDVRHLAQNIIAAQREEVSIMRHAREELAGCPDAPSMNDPHMEEDMMKLKQLSGEALDHAFLIHMIPHHSVAVSLVHRAMPYLQRHDLKHIAHDAFHSQAREIGEMERILEELKEK